MVVRVVLWIDYQRKADILPKCWRSNTVYIPTYWVLSLLNAALRLQLWLLDSNSFFRLNYDLLPSRADLSGPSWTSAGRISFSKCVIHHLLIFLAPSNKLLDLLLLLLIRSDLLLPVQIYILFVLISLGCIILLPACWLGMRPKGLLFFNKPTLILTAPCSINLINLCSVPLMISQLIVLYTIGSCLLLNLPLINERDIAFLLTSLLVNEDILMISDELVLHILQLVIHDDFPSAVCLSIDSYLFWLLNCVELRIDLIVCNEGP